MSRHYKIIILVVIVTAFAISSPLIFHLLSYNYEKLAYPQWDFFCHNSFVFEDDDYAYDDETINDIVQNAIMEKYPDIPVPDPVSYIHNSKSLEVTALADIHTTNNDLIETVEDALQKNGIANVELRSVVCDFRH